MNFHKFLRLFDLYGVPISFTYKGSLQYRTAFGGCLSICMATFLFMIFLFKLTHIGNVDYQQVQITQMSMINMGQNGGFAGKDSHGLSNAIDLSDPISSQGESGLVFGYRLIQSDGTVLKTGFQQYGRLLMMQYKMELNSSTTPASRKISTTELATEACSMNNPYFKLIDSEYVPDDISNYNCLAQSDYYVQGFPKTDVNQKIYFIFQQCTTTNCATYEALQAWLSGLKLQFITALEEIGGLALTLFMFCYIFARFFHTQLLWASLMHKLFYIQSFAKPIFLNNYGTSRMPQPPTSNFQIKNDLENGKNGQSPNKNSDMFNMSQSVTGAAQYQDFGEQDNINTSQFESNPTLQEQMKEENADRMDFIERGLERQIFQGPQFKHQNSLYKEIFELVRTRARFKANNRAFLGNMFLGCCKKQEDLAEKFQLGSSQQIKSGCCCRRKIPKESEQLDPSKPKNIFKHEQKIRYLDLNQQFNKGKDTLIKELDAISVIKKLRKVELMQKILFSLPQSILLNYQKKNLVDQETDNSDDDLLHSMSNRFSERFLKSKKQVQLYQAVDFYKKRPYLMPNDTKILLGLISNHPSKMIQKFNAKKIKVEKDATDKKVREQRIKDIRNGLPDPEKVSKIKKEKEELKELIKKQIKKPEPKQTLAPPLSPSNKMQNLVNRTIKGNQKNYESSSPARALKELYEEVKQDNKIKGQDSINETTIKEKRRSNPKKNKHQSDHKIAVSSNTLDKKLDQKQVYPNKNENSLEQILERDEDNLLQKPPSKKYSTKDAPKLLPQSKKDHKKDTQKKNDKVAGLAYTELDETGDKDEKPKLKQVQKHREEDVGNDKVAGKHRHKLDQDTVKKTSGDLVIKQDWDTNNNGNRNRSPGTGRSHLEEDEDTSRQLKKKIEKDSPNHKQKVRNSSHNHQQQPALFTKKDTNKKKAALDSLSLDGGATIQDRVASKDKIKHKKEAKDTVASHLAVDGGSGAGGIGKKKSELLSQKSRKRQQLDDEEDDEFQDLYFDQHNYSSHQLKPEESIVKRSQLDSEASRKRKIPND
eukprot:403356316